MMQPTEDLQPVPLEEVWFDIKCLTPTHPFLPAMCSSTVCQCFLVPATTLFALSCVPVTATDEITVTLVCCLCKAA